MAITVNEAGLFRIDLDTPEGWYAQFNQNLDILRDKNGVGGLCVQPRDIDPATFLATSRYFRVNSGYMRINRAIARVAGFVDQLAPASTSVNIWLDSQGSLYQGAAFPTTYSYVPLAYITCDAFRITAIADYRNPFATLGGPIALSRVAITGNYTLAAGVNQVRADATAGPITITLPAPATFNGQLIYIRKADAGANAVTLSAAALIEGAGTYVLAARGTVGITSTGTTYEVVV